MSAEDDISDDDTARDDTAEDHGAEDDTAEQQVAVGGDLDEDEPISLEEAEADFTRPWSVRRGLEALEDPVSTVLVRAPVDRVGRALSKDALRWKRNVMGRRIEVAQRFSWLYRLAGHEWTGILAPEHLDPDRPRTLSAELGVAVLMLAADPESQTIGYVLFDRGEMIEALDAPEGELATFDSTERDPNALGVTDPFEATDAVLVRLDAYVPDLDENYFFQTDTPMPGSLLEVQNPGYVFVVDAYRQLLSIPVFERVDYLVFQE